MALSVYVILHEQVIFLFRHLLRQVQIATLEARLEQKSFILGISQSIDLTVKDLCCLRSHTT